MTANSTAIPTKRNFYVDPAGGSDANPGTKALPFQTWNGGVWPAVLQLRDCDVQVTYTTSTADTSLNTLYQVPVGVRVTVSSPWVDSGLGTKTSAAGSTSTQVVVTGGGLVANAQEGMRLRWTAGAMNGQVYFIPQNSTTTLQRVGGIGGMNQGPVNGTSFVVEVPAGGWSLSSAAPTNVAIDATAAGAGFAFNGFFISSPGTVGLLGLLGNIAAAGLMVNDTIGGGQTELTFQNSVTLGSLQGGQIVPGLLGTGAPNVPLGGADRLGCSLISTTASLLNFDACSAWVIDLVLDTAGGGIDAADARLAVRGLDAVSGGVLISCLGCNAFFDQFTNDANSSPFVFDEGGTAVVQSSSFGTAFAGQGVVARNGVTVTLTSCTGANGAPVVGVFAEKGATVVNGGGNTLAGATAAVQMDGVNYTAWASISSALQSTRQGPGLMAPFAGRFTGAAGAATGFLGWGGLSTQAASATAMLWPQPVGTNYRNLRGRILANASAATVTYTMMLAPAATGTPATTALTLNVGAGVTGAVADTTHTFVAQNGDYIDLRATSTAGGAGNNTDSTWMAQAA